MKKNSLSSAIVAGFAGVAGLAGMANAVNVNPDGLGQVLLYPYYTVNANNATLISIVNTTDEGKAVKVRFLEALNSAEVLDFNLYLSPFDVWAASVRRTDAGAAVFTEDTSCTVPLGVGKDWVGDVPGVDSGFVQFEFQNNNPDIVGLLGAVRLGGSTSGDLVDLEAADRMRQGHIEAIEMGVLLNEAGTTFDPLAWATHTASTGAPLNCSLLSAAWSSGGGWVAENGRAMDAPSGGLFGAGVIVDVPQGRALSYNADAIDGFFSPVGLAADFSGTEADLHSPPGDVQPNLTRARTNADDSATANIFVNGTVISPRFEDGIDAVSAVLMSRYIFNEFNLDATLVAASEWVVTFPTKRSHTYVAVGSDVRPFSDSVDQDISDFDDSLPFDTFGLCETYEFTRWDREELPSAPIVDVPIISPPPPGPVGAVNPSLCWESNVVAFNQDLSSATTPTAVLGATPAQGAHGLSGLFTGIDAGWARIEFDNPAVADFQNYLASDGQGTDALAADLALVGLPVIGFWAADYSNENVEAGVRANFSQTQTHRHARGYAVLTAPAPAFGTPLDTTGLSGFGVSAGD